jgi:transposase
VTAPHTSLRPGDATPAGGDLHCDNCGSPAERLRRRWCGKCYFRWYRAGADPTQPPPDTDHGPTAAAYRRDELTHLLQGGASLEQAADRLGISISAARAYLWRAARHECATQGCTAAATWRESCATHKDLPGRYRQLRTEGLSRHAAAALIPVASSTTYRWEPGQPGIGRPRKRQAVAA